MRARVPPRTAHRPTAAVPSRAVLTVAPALPAVAAAAAAAAANNKPKERTELQKKIDARERREAEEAAKKAALKKKLALDSVPDSEMDEKLRQKKMQEAADLDNAMDTFGVMDAGGALDAGGDEFDAMDSALDQLMGHHPKGKAAAKAASAAPAGPSSIESMALDKAKSDKEFEQLAVAVNKHLVQYEVRARAACSRPAPSACACARLHAQASSVSLLP